MLKHGLFCVYDRKSGCFLTPFSAPNEGTAVRMLVQREMVDPGVFSQFPDDFFLSQIAEWDIKTGRVTRSEDLPLVGEMRDLLKEVKSNA